MPDTLAIIGLIAETIPKFINNTRCKIFRYKDFKSERMGKLAFTFKSDLWFASSVFKKYLPEVISRIPKLLSYQHIFSMEIEKQNKFYFLDVPFSIYRKTFFNGVYSNFESYFTFFL